VRPENGTDPREVTRGTRAYPTTLRLRHRRLCRDVAAAGDPGMEHHPDVIAVVRTARLRPSRSRHRAMAWRLRRPLRRQMQDDQGQEEAPAVYQEGGKQAIPSPLAPNEIAAPEPIQGPGPSTTVAPRRQSSNPRKTIPTGVDRIDADGTRTAAHRPGRRCGRRGRRGTRHRHRRAPRPHSRPRRLVPGQSTPTTTGTVHVAGTIARWTTTSACGGGAGSALWTVKVLDARGLAHGRRSSAGSTGSTPTVARSIP
jgi:hypothetical protein